MMGHVNLAIVLGVLLCSGHVNAQLFGPNWLSGLQRSINEMTRNIDRNVRRFNEGIQKQVAEIQREVAAGNGSSIVTTNGNTVILNSGGETRTIMSGRTAEGKPYVRDVTDVYQGNVLRHTERIRNPETGQTNEFGYTLDLADPSAKPVPFNNTA